MSLTSVVRHRTAGRGGTYSELKVIYNTKTRVVAESLYLSVGNALGAYC